MTRVWPWVPVKRNRSLSLDVAIEPRTIWPTVKGVALAKNPLFSTSTFELALDARATGPGVVGPGHVDVPRERIHVHPRLVEEIAAGGGGNLLVGVDHVRASREMPGERDDAGERGRRLIDPADVEAAGLAI